MGASAARHPVGGGVVLNLYSICAYKAGSIAARQLMRHGSAALKFIQHQTLPSTFVMGVTRLAVHMWLN